MNQGCGLRLRLAELEPLLQVPGPAPVAPAAGVAAAAGATVVAGPAPVAPASVAPSVLASSHLKLSEVGA